MKNTGGTKINTFEYILQNVEKPQQYIGLEYNLKPKDGVLKRPDCVKFLLSFPDTYEIGMSNFAGKILYEILDNVEYVAADRAFVPLDDYAGLLKKFNYPLTSLNYKIPVKDFDVVGFTLEYELNFSNMVHFLDLAGIPLLAKERGENAPIIIAGGSACVNPEPVADFVDVFFIGDGEPALLDISETVKLAKEKGMKREEILIELSKIDGAYVPAFYEPVYDETGNQTGLKPLKDFVKDKIRMRVVTDLNDCKHPVRFLVPNFETVFNRGIAEIARGCVNACRFCQAGFIYRPYRERNAESLKQILRDLITNTGYSDLSLNSLSATDYPELFELIDYVLNLNKDKKFCDALFSVSLPSQRISTFTVKLAEALKQNRKSGLTFAPEAGSQRMRDIINKNVSADDLFNTVDAALNAGYKLIKLYFMIGLPFETDDDLKEIAELVAKINGMARERKVKFFDVNITFSTFVPKPHTPFQWADKISEDEIIRRQLLLKNEIKRFRNVAMKFTNGNITALEAAFARGSRKLGSVLVNANRLGCRFDAWDDRLDIKKWQQAFSEAGMNMFEYASRKIGIDDFLPWSVVDIGVNPNYLKNEFKKASEVVTTEKCDPKICRRCGVCK